MEQGIVVRGIAFDKDVARISIIAVPEKARATWQLYSRL